MSVPVCPTDLDSGCRKSESLRTPRCVRNIGGCDSKGTGVPSKSFRGVQSVTRSCSRHRGCGVRSFVPRPPTGHGVRVQGNRGIKRARVTPDKEWTTDLGDFPARVSEGSSEFRPPNTTPAPRGGGRGARVGARMGNRAYSRYKVRATNRPLHQPAPGRTPSP